ncbi:MAG: GTPase HflX [bacterium]
MLEIPRPGEEQRETAVLVTVVLPGTPMWVAEDHMQELAALADTAGADIVESVFQRKMKLDSATYAGAGKVSEIAGFCRQQKANLVIFDDDLTPVQVRNLEDRLKVKVLDRSALILDIFARRARTREAKVQVELAQMEYYYPRLTKMWSHLRGQQGGIGFRGPGETQLEVDRRAVQRKITSLKKELVKIARQRQTQRSGRSELPTAALVGYTNVGKSTLLNSLSNTNDAYVENRLFATLDSKVRRIEPTLGRPILVIDTVGFIRKLPHHLVASFRSTLEEAQHAQVLVHVADLSHPHVEDQIIQTKKVLQDLGLEEKPQQLVFNKIDAVLNPGLMEKMRDKYPSALFISAEKGLRLWELTERLENLLYVGTAEAWLALQPEQLRMLDEFQGSLVVRDREWEDGRVKLVISGPRETLTKALRRLGNPTVISSRDLQDRSLGKGEKSGKT